jgi:hypothetical protein
LQRRQFGKVNDRGDGDPIRMQIEPDRLVHREITERVRGLRQCGPRRERQGNADGAQGGQPKAG